jgi:hypothetical protein
MFSKLRYDENSSRAQDISTLREFLLDLYRPCVGSVIGAVKNATGPQDSTDEPVSELLMRIQTEKARLTKERLLAGSQPKAGNPEWINVPVHRRPHHKIEEPVECGGRWGWRKSICANHGCDDPSPDGLLIDASAFSDATPGSG